MQMIYRVLLTVSGIFQATYKCVQISRQTRADEVVKMILSSYGSDEPPEKFVLVESLSDSEGKLNIFSIATVKSDIFFSIGKTNFYANHSWSNIFARKVDTF